MSLLWICKALKEQAWMDGLGSESRSDDHLPQPVEADPLWRLDLRTGLSGSWEPVGDADGRINSRHAFHYDIADQNVR